MELKQRIEEIVFDNIKIYSEIPAEEHDSFINQILQAIEEERNEVKEAECTFYEEGMGTAVVRVFQCGNCKSDIHERGYLPKYSQSCGYKVLKSVLKSGGTGE